MTWLLCDNKRVNLNISFVMELKLIFLYMNGLFCPKLVLFSNKEDLVTHGKAKSKQENDTTYNSCTFPTTPMLGHRDNIVKEIIKHKSNFVEYVKKLNQFGYNPMYFATANGHVKIVKMLL